MQTPFPLTTACYQWFIWLEWGQGWVRAGISTICTVVNGLLQTLSPICGSHSVEIINSSWWNTVCTSKRYTVRVANTPWIVVMARGREKLIWLKLSSMLRLRRCLLSRTTKVCTGSGFCCVHNTFKVYRFAMTDRNSNPINTYFHERVRISAPFSSYKHEASASPPPSCVISVTVLNKELLE